MAAILVSGGTYSGSGDLTCDAVVLGGTQTADWDGTGTFICPDGVLTIVGNSDIGYTDCAIFLRNGNSDTWTHNGGTVRFVGTGLQRVTDYYNAAWTFYDIEVQNSNASLYEGVNWGSPWSSDTNMNNLTISGLAHFRCENRLTSHFNVTGTVDIISGSFVRNATPINSDELNAFGALAIGANGTYAAAANGGEVLSITNAWYGDHMAWDNNLGGTFTHNNGTVSFDYQTSYQNVRNASQWFYNVISTNRETSYQTGLQWMSHPKIANDLTVVSGASSWWGSGYDAIVSGTVICSGNIGRYRTYTPPYTTPTGDWTFGSIVVDGDGELGLSSETVTINNKNGDDYKFRVLNNCIVSASAGTLILDASTEGGMYHNTGSNGKELYNLTVKNDTTDARVVQNVGDVTVTNDLIVSGAGSVAASWDVGFYNAGSGDFDVAGTATVINGAKLGRNIQAGDFGGLVIGAKGWFDAGSGDTLLHGTASPLVNNDTFTHNSGTVVYSGSAYTMVTGDAATTFYDVVSKTVAATDGLRINSPTAIGATILNSIKCEVGYMARFDSGNGNALTTLGDSTHQCTVYNSGTRWRIAPSTNYTVDIYGGSELLPFIWKGTAPVWNISVARPDRPTSFKWCDFKTNSVDLVTPGVSVVDPVTDTYRIALDGACEFAGVEVTAPDRFDINGEYASFSGVFDVTAGAHLYNTAGASDKIGMIVGSAEISTYGTNNAAYLTIIQDGGYFDPDQTTYNQIFFRDGTSTIGGTRSLSATPVTVGGTTNFTSKFTCGNIAIAAGGTMTSTVNPTIGNGSFSNRGGLFASSSAFDFNGAATGADINCGSSVSIDNIFDGGGTAEAWIKIEGDASSASGMRPINKDSWFFSVDNEVEDTSYTLRFYYDWTILNPSWTTVDPLLKDKWYHIAVTYDNSDVANEASIYVNGKRVVAPLTSISGTRVTDATADFIIGNRDGDFARTFNGPIAMVRLFNTTRTGAEIRTDMFNQYSDMDDKTGLMGMWQFDEGQGLSVTDVSTSGNTGVVTLSGSAWADGGTWTAGGILSSSAGDLYIGNGGTAATVFASSYFNINNYKLISGSKFASKSHEGTDFYYVATSGASDYMNYSALAGAPILTPNDLHILANSYFNFDTSANNNQCDEITNYAGSTIRIVSNADFYTQDFDNQGTWLRNATYDGIIHDDGSTPHEYEPIDIMDDQDSPFDAEDLID